MNIEHLKSKFECSVTFTFEELPTLLLHIQMLRKQAILAQELKSMFCLYSVHESYTHAISRTTTYLVIDGQACFYRQLFRCCKTTRVHCRACALPEGNYIIGLHGIPNCSYNSSLGPPCGMYVSAYVTN